ncbi:MAG: zinc metalloprotease HtpX [Actinomycetota bacterium]
MSNVLRRSLPSISVLLGLVLAVGVAAVLFLGAPPYFPAVFAIGFLLVQYLINPYIIQWLVPATVIEHDGSQYLTDHRVGAIVARRCADAGVPLVRLGIVDDGTPNAFTFGRTPRDARVWLTRGLLERLDDDELDAVVTHELGHVKHWDFAVMTIAAVVPMLLYFVFVIGRSDRNGAIVAWGAYVAYWIAQFTLLSLSRAREYAADRYSCECTGKGEALSSALVKIAYGMGQVRSEEEHRVAALLASKDKQSKKEGNRLRLRCSRMASMRVMGILEPRVATAMSAVTENGVDGNRALAALRWDVANPWAGVLEKLSSHPLVARRIQALQASGLPGAPTNYGTLVDAAEDPQLRADLRGRFLNELAICVAPWITLALAFPTAAITQSAVAVGAVVAIAGVLFWCKQLTRYPGKHLPIAEVTGLLTAIEAGPVRGIPVNVRGHIIGRGMPGYVLSADLVVQDESGFVPLLYRNPIPFASGIFGLFVAPKWLGQEVLASGWYRRMPSPVIELREVRTVSGTRRARGWEWVARYVAAGCCIAAGLLIVAFGAAG